MDDQGVTVDGLLDRGHQLTESGPYLSYGVGDAA
jgi:hypothetical protein